MENKKLHETLHNTMDADIWAKEFMDLFGHRKDEIDLDLMRAWFANALMRGHDHAIQELTNL